jgi:hypothetical protein
MNVYIHTLTSTSEGVHTYKVQYYGTVTDLPSHAELGVVFVSDAGISSVYSIQDDIDADAIAMLKAGRSLAKGH